MFRHIFESTLKNPSLKEYFETGDWQNFMLCSQDGGMFAVHEGLVCLWSEGFANLIRSEEGKPKVRLDHTLDQWVANFTLISEELDFHHTAWSQRRRGQSRS